MKIVTHANVPTVPQPQLQQTKRRFISVPLCMFFLCLFLILSILLAVSFGSVAIPPLTIVQILLNGTKIFHFAQRWDPSLVIIIWQVRMPVVIGDVLVGAALAVAGVLFQGMLRNPLADPFLIGTSSGAALGATIAFVLPVSTVFGAFFPLTPLLAFIGAITTVLFVYVLARTGGQTPVVTLILAGVVVNAVLVAGQSLILTLWPSENFGQLLGLFNWLSGGVAEVGWSTLTVIAVIVVCGIGIALLLVRVLDVFALGEEQASHLGLHVEWYKFVIVVVASLLTAAAVSISGLVGFVGLVTPHVLRLLLGPRHRVLVPASALGGAIFLTLADLFARTVFAPIVVPVGVCTALVGAPFFLFLLRSNKREYTW
ncbi:MAG TPA: iron ABC transporter permease [Dictyobacter sp.]|jgi:iron complex transport system permease protein|nr:iron ABC transporter permease [Dictyobacter sp.]